MSKHFDFSRIDNSVNYPDTIDVHEHKAPTDESIRLAEEFQDKAIKNILSKVKVQDNLVSGEAYLMQAGFNTTVDYHKIYFKFKINGQEFLVEKEIHRDEMWKENADMDISEINIKLKNMAHAVMLWYVMKKLQQVLFREITKQDLPDYLIK